MREWKHINFVKPFVEYSVCKQYKQVRKLYSAVGESSIPTTLILKVMFEDNAIIKLSGSYNIPANRSISNVRLTVGI